MRAMLALIALCAVVAPISAQQNVNTLYQQDYAKWRVWCTKDAITDRATCYVSGVGPGSRSVLGGDDAQVHFWSANKNANPALTIVMPYLIMPQRGLTIRSDSNQPANFACTEIQKQECIIKGSDRDRLLNDWRNANKVVVRGYTFSENGPDYTFDMRGFNDALQGFYAAVAKFL